MGDKSIRIYKICKARHCRFIFNGNAEDSVDVVFAENFQNVDIEEK